MDEKLSKLIPMFTLYFIVLALVSLTMLSPVIIKAYEPVDITYFLFLLFLIVSVSSASVALVAHLILSGKSSVSRRRKKK